MKVFLVYFTASVLGKLFPFLLVPVLTTELSAEEYGRWALYLSVLSFFEIFITSNSHTYLSKHYHSINQCGVDAILSNIVSIFLINFIIVSFVGISAFYLLSLEFTFFIIPFLGLLNAFVILTLLLLRNNDRPYFYAILEISKIGLSFLFSVFLLKYTDLNWFSCVVGFFLGAVFVNFLSIRSLFSRLRVSLVDLVEIKAIYRLTLPMIPVGLANIANNVADKIIVVQILSAEALGVYAVGYSFAQLISIFIASYIKFWGPICYKKLSEFKLNYGFVNHSVLLYFPAIIIVSILSYLVVDLFLFDLMVGENFSQGKEVVGIVIAALAIQGVYFFSIPFFVKTDRTKELSVITIISAVCNVVLNYLLIPVWGIQGAAYATLFSYLFLSISGHYLNVRYIKKQT